MTRAEIIGIQHKDHPGIRPDMGLAEQFPISLPAVSGITTARLEAETIIGKKKPTPAETKGD